jgi:predicted amidophosphoribosyltransferase
MTPPAAQARPSPVRYAPRYGSAVPGGERCCSLCGTALPSARARYCSVACKQQAYRLRRLDPAGITPARLTPGLERAGDRVAHTVYACPLCDERYLGERRCSDCNRFCRALGPGGPCPHCDEPVLIAELLGKEVVL